MSEEFEALNEEEVTEVASEDIETEEVTVEEPVTEEVEMEAQAEEAVEEIVEEDDEEELEFFATEEVESIIESLLFVSDKPLSLAAIKQVFKGSSVKTRQIKKALDALAIEFASAHRGVTLEEVSGGYRLHTKVDNAQYLKRMTKGRPFRLTGPALEVISIVAYKQPIIKAEIDEIRGVESGHLLRALMDKGLVNFAGKSELPGKPMMYGTTRKFLEIFSLKSLKDLPTLSEIDELLPEGMMDEEEEKPTLGALTDSLSEDTVSNSYSQGEEELQKIADSLTAIDTSTEFFEEEKRRQKEKRDADRARDIQEAIDVGEEVSTRDRNWLARYNEANQEAEPVESVEQIEESTELVEDINLMVDPDDGVGQKQAQKAIEAFENDEAVAEVDSPEEVSVENELSAE